MASDELDKVECPLLTQLQSLGWSYIEGATLSPDESDERNSFKDLLLERRLSASIKRINPWIKAENLRKVVRDLSKTQSLKKSLQNPLMQDRLTGKLRVMV